LKLLHSARLNLPIQTTSLTLLPGNTTFTVVFIDRSARPFYRKNVVKTKLPTQNSMRKCVSKISRAASLSVALGVGPVYLLKPLCLNCWYGVSLPTRCSLPGFSVWN